MSKREHNNLQITPPDPNLLFECSFINTVTDSVSNISGELKTTGNGHYGARMTEQGLLIVNHWNNNEYRGLFPIVFDLPDFPLYLSNYKMEFEWKVGWYRNAGLSSPGGLFSISNYRGDWDGIGNGTEGDGSRYYDKKTPDYDFLYTDNVYCTYDWRKFSIDVSVSGTQLNRQYTNHGSGAHWTSTGTLSSATQLSFFPNWNSANGFVGYIRNMKITTT